MIRPPLPSECLSQYPTDKVGGPEKGCHSYTTFYDRVLPARRWCRAVMEVGIGSGASLRAWKDYFPNAVVIGLEVDRSRLVYEHRIFSIRLDASDPVRLTQFALEYDSYFEFICDDGSHRLEDQLLAVTALKRCLLPGGILVVEDIASPDYAPEFERLGCTVEEFRVDARHDDRIAYYTRGL